MIKKKSESFNSRYLLSLYVMSEVKRFIQDLKYTDVYYTIFIMKDVYLF